MCIRLSNQLHFRINYKDKFCDLSRYRCLISFEYFFFMVCLLRDDVRNMISPTRISGRGKASGVYKALMKWPKWNKGLVVIGLDDVKCVVRTAIRSHQWFVAVMKRLPWGHCWQWHLIHELLKLAVSTPHYSLLASEPMYLCWNPRSQGAQIPELYLLTSSCTVTLRSLDREAFWQTGVLDTTDWFQFRDCCERYTAVILTDSI